MLPRAEQLQSTRLMVVGDLMVDQYLSGHVRRISPEAPVPVLKLEQEEYVLGGAANVAKNLVALGARPTVIGVVGNDALGERLREDVVALGLPGEGILTVAHRPTTLKTRVVSQTHQMIRIDRETEQPIEGEPLQQLEAFMLARLDACDAVVLSDYGKGLLSPPIVERVIAEARRRDLRVFVDPKGFSFDKYRGASFITPNRAEAQRAAGGRPLENEEQLRQAAEEWIEQLGLEGMLITLGKAGLFVATGSRKDGRCRSIEAEEREVYDITGAGDTVLATFSLLLTAGLDVFEAACWANRAAGVVVGKAGAAVVTRSELENYARRFEPWQRKVKTVEELRSVVKEARRRGHRIVFTNGCFDLLHVGHIQLLQEARRLGDLLIVGMNSDASVAQLKGAGRPLIPEKERLQILASLDCVDQLVVFSETTPNALLEALRPDVLVKGANYSPEEVTGHEIVESYGGRVELVPIRSQVSVSGLVDHIVEHFGREERR